MTERAHRRSDRRGRFDADAGDHGNTPSYHHAREPHQGIRFPRRRVAGRHLQADLRTRPGGSTMRVSRRRASRRSVERGPQDPGRPGAVLLDVPMDCLLAGTPRTRSVTSRGVRTSSAPRPRRGIAEAAKLLASAQAPVIFAGNGVTQSEAATNCVRSPKRSLRRWQRR
jgi:hypothetical protein